MPPFAKYPDLHRYHFSLRSTTRQILLTNKLLYSALAAVCDTSRTLSTYFLETLKRGVTAILKFEISSNIHSEKTSSPEKKLGKHLQLHFRRKNDKFQTSNREETENLISFRTNNPAN